MSDDHSGLSHDLPEYTPNVPPERQTGRAWKPRTALMVGGPADGQWRTVEAPTVEVVELPRFEWKTPAAETTLEPKRYLYHVDRLAMFGFGVWVAVCEREFMGSTERNKAVLRALLQRDVAQEMGVL